MEQFISEEKLRRLGKCSFVSTAKQSLYDVVCVEKELGFRAKVARNCEHSLQRVWFVLQ